MLSESVYMAMAGRDNSWDPHQSPPPTPITEQPSSPTQHEESDEVERAFRSIVDDSMYNTPKDSNLVPRQHPLFSSTPAENDKNTQRVEEDMEGVALVHTNKRTIDALSPDINADKQSEKKIQLENVQSERNHNITADGGNPNINHAPLNEAGTGEATLSSIMNAILKLDETTGKMGRKLDTLDKKIDDIGKSIDKKISDAMDEATKNMTKVVDDKVKVLKAEVTGDVTEKLQALRADWAEAQKRVSNLFLYDTPEAGEVSKDEREGWDCNEISTYLEKLGIQVEGECHGIRSGPRRPGMQTVTLRQHDRVGAQKDDKDMRPVKIILSSMYERDTALRLEAKLLKEGKIPKRRLSKDFTKSERELFKKLKKEVQTREANGDKGWYVTNDYTLAKKKEKKPFRGGPRNGDAGDN